MEAILSQASTQSVEQYALFSSTFCAKEDLDFLLQLFAQIAGSMSFSNILTHLTRVIPFFDFLLLSTMQRWMRSSSISFIQKFEFQSVWCKTRRWTGKDFLWNFHNVVYILCLIYYLIVLGH